MDSSSLLIVLLSFLTLFSHMFCNFIIEWRQRVHSLSFSPTPCFIVLHIYIWFLPECSNYCIIALISHASKVMLKILQARLLQYVNRELPDVQAGFRKGRGTRDQIANIRWIMEKATEFQKNIYFCFYWLCQSLRLCGSQSTVENSERDGNTRPPDLPIEKPICSSGSNI